MDDDGLVVSTPESREVRRRLVPDAKKHGSPAECLIPRRSACRRPLRRTGYDILEGAVRQRMLESLQADRREGRRQPSQLAREKRELLDQQDAVTSAHPALEPFPCGEARVRDRRSPREVGLHPGCEHRRRDHDRRLHRESSRLTRAQDTATGQALDRSRQPGSGCHAKEGQYGKQVPEGLIAVSQEQAEDDG
jgi:hypothetical protein